MSSNPILRQTLHAVYTLRPFDQNLSVLPPEWVAYIHNNGSIHDAQETVFYRFTDDANGYSRWASARSADPLGLPLHLAALLEASPQGSPNAGSNTNQGAGLFTWSGGQGSAFRQETPAEAHLRTLRTQNNQNNPPQTPPGNQPFFVITPANVNPNANPAVLNFSTPSPPAPYQTQLQNGPQPLTYYGSTPPLPTLAQTPSPPAPGPGSGWFYPQPPVGPPPPAQQHPVPGNGGFQYPQPPTNPFGPPPSAQQPPVLGNGGFTYPPPPFGPPPPAQQPPGSGNGGFQYPPPPFGPPPGSGNGGFYPPQPFGPPPGSGNGGSYPPQPFGPPPPAQQPLVPGNGGFTYPPPPVGPLMGPLFTGPQPWIYGGPEPQDGQPPPGFAPFLQPPAFGPPPSTQQAPRQTQQRPQRRPPTQATTRVQTGRVTKRTPAPRTRREGPRLQWDVPNRLMQTTIHLLFDEDGQHRNLNTKNRCRLFNHIFNAEIMRDGFSSMGLPQNRVKAQANDRYRPDGPPEFWAAIMADATDPAELAKRAALQARIAQAKLDLGIRAAGERIPPGESSTL